ncbi:MAG: hypothetical protein LBF85_09000 [Tannerella sp.]|nr:hypothetical protein [Tannerella sp.]
MFRYLLIISPLDCFVPRKDDGRHCLQQWHLRYCDCEVRSRKQSRVSYFPDCFGLCPRNDDQALTRHTIKGGELEFIVEE